MDRHIVRFVGNEQLSSFFLSDHITLDSINRISQMIVQQIFFAKGRLIEKWLGYFLPGNKLSLLSKAFNLNICIADICMVSQFGVTSIK